MPTLDLNRVRGAGVALPLLSDVIGYAPFGAQFFRSLNSPFPFMG